MAVLATLLDFGGSCDSDKHKKGQFSRPHIAAAVSSSPPASE